MRKSKKNILILYLILVLTVISQGCSSDKAVTSNDLDYENQKIIIEGLDGGDQEISIEQLRKLPQYKLDASYKRTTGMSEEFKMQGPYLKEVLELIGANIEDYEGIGVMGKDAYYCLLSEEVVKATPDIMVATVIDGKAKLDEADAPARLAVQGQFGPYWVKMVNRIILYKEVPHKKITSVWSFKNLSEGIEPYEYEYYGNKDDAIELEQIFSRLDYVDSKAFFTIKSSDGFKKSEALNMVKSRYYLKVEGVDAPTNISPYIKLGMNVKNIAWVSTNADALIFPKELEKYIDLKEVNGQNGIPLNEIMYETGVDKLKGERFDILGTKGEKITVAGEDLEKGILIVTPNDEYKIVWQPELGVEDIANMMRIRLVVQ